MPIKWTITSSERSDKQIFAKQREDPGQLNEYKATIKRI